MELTMRSRTCAPCGISEAAATAVRHNAAKKALIPPCYRGARVSVVFPDPVQPRSRPDNQTVARDSRRGHAHLIERVLSKQLEFLARLNHEGVAILAEGEDFSVVGPRRRCERRRRRIDPLLAVNLLAGARVMASKEPAV